MSWWFELFVERVPLLGLGVTLILGSGALVAAGRDRRASAGRQAWAEWSVLVAAAWVLCSVVPAPRWVVAEAGVAGFSAVPREIPAASVESAPSRVAERGNEAGSAATGVPVMGERVTRSPARGPVGEERLERTAPIAPSSTQPGRSAAPTHGSRRVAPGPTPDRQAVDASAAPWSWEGPTRRILAAAWLAVAALALAWLVLGAVGLRRVLRDCRPVRDLPEELRDRVRRCSPRAVVVASPGVPRPFVCGWWRPRIVLPTTLLAPERRATLAHVLAHECAHLTHGDLGGRYLLAAAMPLLAWNPLFWWLRARIRLDAELRADAAAAGRAPIDYARHLVDYASQAAARSLPPAARPLAAFASRSEFVRRMQMLLDRRTPVPTRVSVAARAARWSLAPLLLLGSAGLFGVPLPAQDPGDRVDVLRRENAELRTRLAAQEAQIEALTARIEALIVRIDAGQQAASDLFLGSAEQVDRSAGELSREMVERLQEVVRRVAEQAGRGEVSLGALVSDRQLSDEASSFFVPARTADVEEVEEVLRAANQPVHEVADAEEIEEVVEAELVDAIEEVEEPEGVADEFEVVEESVVQEGVVLDVPRPERSGATRAGSVRSARSGRFADSLAVLELASRAVDMEIAMKEAAQALERLQPLAESGRVSTAELQRAENDYERARRKRDIVRNLVSMEIEVLDQRIEEQRKLIDAGYARDDGGIRRLIMAREQLALAR